MQQNVFDDSFFEVIALYCSRGIFRPLERFRKVPSGIFRQITQNSPPSIIKGQTTNLALKKNFSD
jgi:hypothetical protein